MRSCGAARMNAPCGTLPRLNGRVAHAAQRHHLDVVLFDGTLGMTADGFNGSIGYGHVGWWGKARLKVEPVFLHEPLHGQGKSGPWSNTKHVGDHPEGKLKPALLSIFLFHVTEPSRLVRVLPSPLKPQCRYLVWEAMYN